MRTAEFAPSNIGPDQLACPPLTLGDTRILAWPHQLGTNLFESTGTKGIVRTIKGLDATPVIAVDNDRLSYRLDVNDSPRMEIYRTVADKQGILAFADFGTLAENAERKGLLEQLAKEDKTDENILIPGGAAIGAAFFLFKVLHHLNKGNNEVSRRSFLKQMLIFGPIAAGAGVAVGLAGREYFGNQQKAESTEEEAAHLENCDSNWEIEPSEVRYEVAARTGIIAYKMKAMNNFLQQRLPQHTFSKAAVMGSAHSIPPYPQISEEVYRDPKKARDILMHTEAKYLLSQGFPKDVVITGLENLFLDIAGVKLIQVTTGLDGSFIYSRLASDNRAGDAIRADWYLDPELLGKEVTKDTKAQEIDTYLNRQANSYYQEALDKK